MFDKSFLESLNPDEAVWLDRFFLSSITPLFFVETLADLERQVHRGRTPEQVVGSIAYKTPDMQAHLNPHHMSLVWAEFNGEKVTMDGRIMRAGGQVAHLDQLDNRWMGGKREVDSTHNSIIVVTNAGRSVTTALLTFHYNGGKNTYQIERGIVPGDQLWLNLGDVIHGGIADDQGRTFPPDLTGGTYELTQADDGTQPSLFEGKITVDKTYGHLTYGCLDCCTQSAAQMLANPEQLALYGQDNLGVWAYDSCFDDQEDVSTQFNTWDTNNHSVATMSGRRVTGVGVGAANGDASGFLIGQAPKYCPQRGAGAGNINNVGPYQVEPIATASQGPADCTLHTQSGWIRNVTNQVQYVTGAAYAVSGLTVADNITITTPNNLGIGNIDENQAPTTGDGSLPDSYYVCSSACPGSGYTDALQNWIVAGIPLHHVDGNTYTCPSITIDGH
jgi:hypothetical protein